MPLWAPPAVCQQLSSTSKQPIYLNLAFIHYLDLLFPASPKFCLPKERMSGVLRFAIFFFWRYHPDYVTANSYAHIYYFYERGVVDRTCLVLVGIFGCF